MLQDSSVSGQKEGKSVAQQIWLCFFFFLFKVSLSSSTFIKHLTFYYFFFSGNILKNSLQEQGVLAEVVGRRKDAITLGVREGTLLPVVPFAGRAGPGCTSHCLSCLVQYVFDYQDRDIFGCVADIGWITGHTYVVYGPLCNGGTTVLFESTPIHPNPGE